MPRQQHHKFCCRSFVQKFTKNGLKRWKRILFFQTSKRQLISTFATLLQMSQFSNQMMPKCKIRKDHQLRRRRTLHRLEIVPPSRKKQKDQKKMQSRISSLSNMPVAHRTRRLSRRWLNNSTSSKMLMKFWSRLIIKRIKPRMRPASPLKVWLM